MNIESYAFLLKSKVRRACASEGKELPIFTGTDKAYPYGT